MYQETTNLSNEVKVLSMENKKLEQRIEKLENTLFTSKEVLTLEEAAIFLGLTRSAMYKMTHKQVIPFYRPNGKMVYFEKSELLAWLRRNRSSSQMEIEAAAQKVLENLSTK